MNLKRTFLIGLIASLTASALIGISSMFLGQWWELQMQVIMTMMTIALFSLTSLMAVLAFEKNTWRPAMVISLALSVIAVTSLLLAIWLSDLIEPLPPAVGRRAPS